VNNLLLLNSVAQLLADEPKALVNLIKDNLDMGKSFPQARADALHQYVGKDYEDIHDVLTGSNNILAIEYLRVIREGCIPFSPIIVKRKGSLYHDVSLSPFASATAIRHHLFTSPGLHHLNPSIPQATFNILERETAKGRCPVSLAPLERAILLKLRSLSLPKLRNIYEINEGLEFLFKEAANQSGTLDELIKTVKSKRYSLTRIKRTLLYILFNLTQEQILCFDQHGPLYLHILGFSSKGQKSCKK
jgi:predicted nucleotidyltransferase